LGNQLLEADKRLSDYLIEDGTKLRLLDKEKAFKIKVKP
jgi:hypothetical protein